ncbi:hypothetical protein NBH00_22635 [Paraconexibacter antarcticus]|uniref:Metalloenzyme domain-containing protein n=1 Tax=Paraconexibacter antarcticus TaxID=2949664 RepID=A0ABY5DTT4_9ACTN|nr:hypothetical protein [Paraconexibacter antarcticus]UTI64122.1 hypothetical protein NBH00_22635 [Paraconexibacter antarcticus]
MCVTVILDGASEPVHGDAPTSLERADTPTLDALVARGTLTRRRTVPDGLAPGSEVAIPNLLGWTPPAAVDRGAVEAAAREIPVAAGHRAWRIDVRCPTGGRAGAVAVARAAEALRRGAPHHALHELGGHRLLLVGPAPLPDVAAAARGVHVWPEGIVPPPVLDGGTVVVAAPGAAAGIAALLGAQVVTPPGATGGPDSDLRAKTDAARVALGRRGVSHVVVHVGGADEASHLHDADAKVALLERADREVVAPLADSVRELGGTLTVLPDHGCDPSTGGHDALPVPVLTWRPADMADRAREAGDDGPARRLTERAVAALPVLEEVPA